MTLLWLLTNEDREALEDLTDAVDELTEALDDYATLDITTDVDELVEYTTDTVTRVCTITATAALCTIAAALLFR